MDFERGKEEKEIYYVPSLLPQDASPSSTPCDAVSNGFTSCFLRARLGRGRVSTYYMHMYM